PDGNWVGNATRNGTLVTITVGPEGDVRHASLRNNTAATTRLAVRAEKCLSPASNSATPPTPPLSTWRRCCCSSRTTSGGLWPAANFATPANTANRMVAAVLLLRSGIPLRGYFLLLHYRSQTRILTGQPILVGRR